MSWRRLALLVMSTLAVHLMSGSSAIGTIDGIQLTVAHGALPGDVALTWSFGTEPFQVFRSDEPGNVSDPANLIGQTLTSDWIDTPPVGRHPLLPCHEGFRTRGGRKDQRGAM